MPSHNRRDPRLPDLIAVELMDQKSTWQEVMARAKAKLVMQPVEDRHVKSGVEKSSPRENEESKT